MKREFENQHVAIICCVQDTVSDVLCYLIFTKDMQSGHNYLNSSNEENEALKTDILFFRPYN